MQREPRPMLACRVTPNHRHWVLVTIQVVLFLGSAVATVSASDGSTAAALPRAHAHNDYRHRRPLIDALDHGFCSVEADIFLVDGRLLVGHNRSELKRDRTLQSLYLEPLRRRLEEKGSRVHPGGPPLTLLIDVKSEADTTYRALRDVLADYADILSRVDGDKVVEGAVTVIISGNRALSLIEADSPRFAAVDGRLSDLNTRSSSTLIPLISDNWAGHFRWRGRGPIADDERQKLRSVVIEAHRAGRRVRFWRTPEDRDVWNELWTAGVDLINTDDLSGLGAFMRDKQAVEFGLRLVFSGRDPLPEFEMAGRRARVHTQGLYVTDSHDYVSGRLEAEPKRALLIRFERQAPRRVSHVDITPRDHSDNGSFPLLDHPGGFDFDGESFWIPVAESRPHSRTVVVKFPHRTDIPFAAQEAVKAFSVDDHIGAVAFNRATGRVYGANWDTKMVYLWHPDGTLIQRVAHDQLVQDDPDQALAVQDWKALDHGLVLAGGVDKSPMRPLFASTAVAALLDIPGRQRIAYSRLPNPPHRDLQLAHEGMATHGESVFFLPADLGRDAEVYRYRWIRE